MQPNGYVSVEFSPGTNGTLSGTTTYYVNPGAKRTYAGLAIPTTVPVAGYVVADTPWDPSFAASDTITQNQTHAAQYLEKTGNPEIIRSIAGEQIVTGKAPAGSTVTVGFGGGVTATAETNIDGNWEVTVPDGATLTENGEVAAVAQIDGYAPSDTVTAAILQKSEAPVSKQPIVNDSQVTGTGPANSTILVDFGNNQVVEVTSNADGTWTVNVPDTVTLSNGSTITAMAIEDGKAPSEPVSATVMEQATTPTMNQPQVGDTSVTGTAPANSDVVVDFGGGNTVTVTAGPDGNWTADAPTSAPLTEGRTITATATESSKAASQPATTTVAAQDITTQPTITQPKVGDTAVTGTAPADSDVVVDFGGGNTVTVTAGPDGNWTADVPAEVTLADGSTVTAIATEPGKTQSTPASATVSRPTPTPSPSPTYADQINPKLPAKTPVWDDSYLTRGEKAQVEAAIVNANFFPTGTSMVIDHNGAATITYPDGSWDWIAGNNLVAEMRRPVPSPTPEPVPAPKPTPTPIPIPEPSPEVTSGHHAAYLYGYAEGDFRPLDAMTRAEVTALLSRLLVNGPVSGQTYASNYVDVDADAWYADVVGFMNQQGYVSGYPDGTFRPNDPITRAEFAAMVVRFGQLEKANATFTDVRPDHWAYDPIGRAAGAGWIAGYPDGSFKPDQAINRAEVTAIANRMQDRQGDTTYIQSHLNDGSMQQFTDVQDPSFWAYADIMEATNTHDYRRVDGGDEQWTKLRTSAA